MGLLLLLLNAVAGTPATESDPVGSPTTSSPTEPSKPVQPVFTVTIQPIKLGDGGDLVCQIFSGTTSHVYWVEVREKAAKFNVRAAEKAMVTITAPSSIQGNPELDLIRPECGWGARYPQPANGLPAVQLFCTNTLNDGCDASRIYSGDEVAGSGLACSIDVTQTHRIDCTPVK